MTVGRIFQTPAQTIYRWHRELLSGYPEAIASGKWRQDDIHTSSGPVPVPIFKAENLGPEMAIDEKKMGEEMYTVFSNRETGKIAILAETMNVNELLNLTRKWGSHAQKVTHITCDLSPSYESFCTQAFPLARQTADKFHIVRYMTDAVQAVRIRLRQQEISKLPKKPSDRKRQDQETRLENGETPRELLTRSRYLLFKLSSQWTPSQKKRAAFLFKFYPEIKSAYELVEQIRIWYQAKNIGQSVDILQTQLYEWTEDADEVKIPEISNLVRLMMAHEDKIFGYFITGKTNAKAEAINSHLQRFIASNYGIRDKDFFLYRVSLYFS